MYGRLHYLIEESTPTKSFKITAETLLYVGIYNGLGRRMGCGLRSIALFMRRLARTELPSTYFHQPRGIVRYLLRAGWRWAKQ